MWNYFRHNQINNLPKEGKYIFLACKRFEDTEKKYPKFFITKALYCTYKNQPQGVFYDSDGHGNYDYEIDQEKICIYAWCYESELDTKRKIETLYHDVIDEKDNPVFSMDVGSIKQINEVVENGDIYKRYFNFKNGCIDYIRIYTKEEWEYKLKQDEVYKQRNEKEKLEKEKHELELKLKIQDRKLELTKQWLNNELTEKDYKTLTTEEELYKFFGIYFISGYSGIGYINPYAGFILQENIN